MLTRRRPLDAARNLDLYGDRASLDHWIEHMDWVMRLDMGKRA